MKGQGKFGLWQRKTQLFSILVLCSVSTLVGLNILIEETNVDVAISILRDRETRNHSSACKSKVFESKWKGHFLSNDQNSLHNTIIPTTIEDVQFGVAPSVPESFLIEEEDFCLKKATLKTIVYVSTTTTNTEQRSLIRQGFANVEDEIRAVFFVGRAASKEEEQIITEESQLYHDIVQGNYTDSYYLLIFKSLNALYWLKKNCYNVKWVVHSDDDIAINTPNFLRTIRHLENGATSNEIFCNFVCRVPAVQIGKFQVAKDEYPHIYFPPFCLGTLWFTTIDVVPLLLDSVPRVKFLHLEDIYITGVLAEKAAVRRHYVDVIGHLSIKIN